MNREQVEDEQLVPMDLGPHFTTWASGLLSELENSMEILDYNYQYRSVPTPEDPLIRIAGIHPLWLLGFDYGKKNYRQMERLYRMGYRLIWEEYEPVYQEKDLDMRQTRLMENDAVCDFVQGILMDLIEEVLARRLSGIQKPGRFGESDEWIVEMLREQAGYLDALPRKEQLADRLFHFFYGSASNEKDAAGRTEERLPASEDDGDMETSTLLIMQEKLDILRQVLPEYYELLFLSEDFNMLTRTQVSEKADELLGYRCFDLLKRKLALLSEKDYQVETSDFAQDFDAETPIRMMQEPQIRYRDVKEESWRMAVRIFLNSTENLLEYFRGCMDYRHQVMDMMEGWDRKKESCLKLLEEILSYFREGCGETPVLEEMYHKELKDFLGSQSFWMTVGEAEKEVGWARMVLERLKKELV